MGELGLRKVIRVGTEFLYNMPIFFSSVQQRVDYPPLLHIIYFNEEILESQGSTACKG